MSYCSAPKELKISICSISTYADQEMVETESENRLELPYSTTCDQELSFEIVQSPRLGELSLVGPSSAIYTSATVPGEDSFSFKVCHVQSNACTYSHPVIVHVSPAACTFDRGNSLEDPNVCDIRIIQQSTYSSLDFSRYGVSNNGWSIGGSHFLAGDTHNLEVSLAKTRQEVVDNLLTYKDRFPELKDDEFIIMDIENEIAANRIGNYNDNINLQKDIIAALKMRVEATREVFPNAKLALWNAPKSMARGVVTPEFLEAMEGIYRAASQGLFDEIDYVIPNVYIRYGVDDLPANYLSFEQMTRTGIEYAETIHKSDGSAIPVVPMLSIHVANGSSSEVRVDTWIAQEQLRIIQEYSKVEFVSYWIGNDEYRDIDLIGFLEDVRPLPTVCVCPEN